MPTDKEVSQFFETLGRELMTLTRTGPGRIPGLNNICAYFQARVDHFKTLSDYANSNASVKNKQRNQRQILEMSVVAAEKLLQELAPEKLKDNLRLGDDVLKRVLGIFA